MGLLSNRVALLAGVGVDLGTALARVFAAEGANLVLAARSEDTIRTLAGEIEGMGRKCVWQCTDITDAEACKSLVARAESARNEYPPRPLPPARAPSHSARGGPLHQTHPRDSLAQYALRPPREAHLRKTQIQSV